MKAVLYLLFLASIGLATVNAVENTAFNENSCNPEYNQVDVNYMQSMIEHHQGAVEMAEMVPHHTDRRELVNLSERIIEAQESEIEHMENLLSESCVEPEVDEDKHIAPTERQVNYLDNLNGTEFDLTFINMMAAHHADAVMESRIVLQKGESEQVQEVAQNVIKEQQKEIQQMYDWYLEWIPSANNTNSPQQ